ncbi:MAG: hypothetical protein BHW62_00730 [Acinetobacter sp. CAG:196_36_41]|nr:MAG: hypothetical protein BHW62_00730 [Acinetobacter sp. CAG:196_36_41]
MKPAQGLKKPNTGWESVQKGFPEVKYKLVVWRNEARPRVEKAKYRMGVCSKGLPESKVQVSSLAE